MSDEQLCQHCGGNGVVKIHHGVSVCPRCDGKCWEPPSPAPLDLDAQKFSRVEVIGPAGRSLIARPCEATVSVQDQGRTLKVFLDVEPVHWTEADRAAVAPSPNLDALARETADEIAPFLGPHGDVALRGSQGPLDMVEAIILSALQRVRGHQG